jgi:type VI secretion system protein ImpA
MSEPDLSSGDLLASGEPNGGTAPAPDAAVTAPPAPPASPAPQPVSALAGAVAALCNPISINDPCGPDLEFEGDADYLNYFAGVENILPTSFFSAEDGRPFDRTTIDLPGQIEALNPLLARTRDIRLLIMRARLMILNRDIEGFAVNIGAIAEWLDKYWDAVHPRVAEAEMSARLGALSALDLFTVVLALEYSSLFETRRIGAVTYRAWKIANGEVKPRNGEATLSPAAIVEARSDADPAVLAAARNNVALLKTSLGRIRSAFAAHGQAAGLATLPALVDKMSAFIDPHGAAAAGGAQSAGEGDGAQAKTDEAVAKFSVNAPASLAEASEALAAIAEYYGRSEPSSPTLPLVRQAHALIGKSFFEVMSVLVPTQIEKAAFQIGGDQVFELPVGKLPKPADAAAPLPAPATPSTNGSGSGAAASAGATASPAQPRYRVESRPQAIALLEQVQRFFRQSEPSSPVPWLCERARVLAERDFMAVLRDVLPKAALKNIAADK